MKAIRFNGIMTRYGSRADGGLGLTLVTPELTKEQRSEVEELKGINLDVLLNPLDYKVEETYEIDKEAGQKSLSERLRGVIFIFWKEHRIKEEFEAYYRRAMEKKIQEIKDKI